MNIKIRTNLPDNPETLVDILKVIKHASTEFDIKLEITEYGTKNGLQLSALNNVILESILREQENE